MIKNSTLKVYGTSHGTKSYEEKSGKGHRDVEKDGSFCQGQAHKKRCHFSKDLKETRKRSVLQ